MTRDPFKGGTVMGGHCLAALCLVLGLPLAIASCRADTPNDKGKEPDSKEAKAAIAPELDRCTLDADGRSWKPIRLSKPVLEEHVVKGLRIQMESATIRAIKASQETPVWTAKPPAETKLAWLATDEKIVYFSGYKIDEQSKNYRPESPLRIHQLELDSGKWLDGLVVGGTPGPKQAESIHSALTSGRHVAILTAITDDEGAQLISYCVSCFKSGETRKLWSKTFRAVGKVEESSAVLLWSARSPAKVQPDVQPLSWVGEDVLVCAGPVQDLLCLEGGTGKQLWRVERVWEYQRTFIGPSVWQHFFARTGEGADEKKDEKQQKDEKRPAGRHAIIGGPIVVDVPNGRRGDGIQNIFVAVANGPRAYGEYLSDCVVYELDAGGKPLAMANLPRMIRGGQCQVQKDGVVWACQDGAFAKVGVSRNNGPMLGHGPGGPDLLCRIDWYRHLSFEAPDAWLISAPAGDPIAFGAEFAFRVCAGGYVQKPDAGIYHFPLTMIDLKTGADRTLLLRVPFNGRLPEPKNNYSASESPQGEKRWKTLGAYVLAITWLHVEGKQLQVTLGMQDWTRSVEFDFANGVKEVCEIRTDGTASVVEPLRSSAGKAEVKGGSIVLVFQDDRVERWTPVGARMIVEHWAASAQFPSGTPVLGIGEVAGINGLQMSIHLERNRYRADEPITLEVVVKNNGDKEVDLGMSATDMSSFDMEVRYVGGGMTQAGRMPLTKFGTKFLQQDKAAKNIPILLKAGEQRSYRFALNRMVDLTLSGTYSVAVTRTIQGHDGEGRSQLTSDVLSVEITEPPISVR
jgi:hypothetical protein